VSRSTGTNHPDDVGGKYADAQVVGASYGVKAQALSERICRENCVTVLHLFYGRFTKKVIEKFLPKTYTSWQVLPFLMFSEEKGWIAQIFNE
jgi:hypothetical protein